MSEKKRSLVPRHPAEKVSLGIALTIVAGVVAAVIMVWVNPPDKPPQFDIQRGDPRLIEGRYYLPFTVINRGELTAAQVTVEGNLKLENEEEKASTTFEFIPGRSKAEGVLVFKSPPAGAAVGVVSFQKP